MTIHDQRTASLGNELERLRLEHRERRLRAAVAVLKGRSTEGHRMPGLTQAIASFQADLRVVRERLD